MKRRLFIAVSLLASSVSSAFAAEPLDFSPQPPAIQAGSWVLMDYTTGQILTAGNEHQQRNPASLTKLMTGYVVDRAIDSHRITPDDIVTVGRDAWAKGNPVFDGSSLMFLKEGDRVSVRDLSRGLIVDSGNDACVALADHVAGGQPQFVKMMNDYVQKLNLAIRTLKPSMGLMRRVNTARPMTWPFSPGLSFTVSLNFTICTVKRASPGTGSPSKTVTACCGIKP